MKNKLLKLKKEGKSYSEIQKITGLSKSTISYHLSTKEKTLKRQKERRREIKKKLVDENGGKCQKCGYDKCIEILEFHHLDPKQKDFSIARARSSSYEKLKKETKKCILLCPNCHREEHIKLKAL